MILISIHIYKTAGTTFYSIIDKIFKRNEIVNANIEGVGKYEDDLKNDRIKDKKSIKIIHGHFPFGWHKYFPGTARYISFLRDPQKRIMSDYFYNKEFSEGHNHSYASNMTLVEFLNCDQLLDMDNGQTRYIAGDFTTPYGQCNERMLAVAKKNIDSEFLFVGLTEKFDESLVLINHYLSWKKIYYTNKNVTKGKVLVLSPEEKQIIQERNKFDIELYQYVSDQFEMKKKEIPLFKLKLKLFKVYNFTYKIIHPIYRSIKSNHLIKNTSVKISDKIKVLTQLSFKEGFLLVVGVLISRVTGKTPTFVSQDIFVMGDQMSYIIENGNRIQKINKNNISTFKGIGIYKGMVLYLRRMTTDYNIYGQIFRFEEYKPLIDIVNKFKRKEVRYIVDAGANVGCSTIYLKKIFPDAKVVAIEPQSGNFDILSKNIDLNNMQNDVFPSKTGLWKDNSNLEITTDFRDGREYAFFLKTVKGNSTTHETVSGITVKDILKKYDFPYIDILKIDIEGSEKYLFENETIAREAFENVHFIALEIHDEIVDRAHVVYLLEKLGFEYETFHETLVAYRRNF